MSKEYIETLRDEAKSALASGRQILDDIKDGKISDDQVAEKQEQAQGFFDEAEQKANRIRLMERSEGLSDEPISQLKLGGGGSDLEDRGAKEIGALVKPETKQVALHFGLDEKAIAKTRVVQDGKSFDQELKHRIGTNLFWKFGEKIDQALKVLPSELHGSLDEMKALATSPGGAGGYLVSDTHRTELLSLIGEAIAMRRISRVLPPIPGGSSITPTEEDELSDPEWTSEVSTGSADTVEPFGERRLSPHPLAKRILVSRTILRAATLVDVESWVLSRLAQKFAEAEENGFINGNGAQQPIGLLNAGITDKSTATSNELHGDDIINWAYALPAAYMQAAVILANRSFIRKVRLIHSFDTSDAADRYLWQPGLDAGSPPQILDWPYELSDKYPTGLDSSDDFDDDEIVATIGDFESGYWIVDSLNFEVQRLDELYAENNQVGFIGRKETDGMVVRADAFRNLKITA